VAHTPCSLRPFGPAGPFRARALSPLPLSVLAGPPVSAAAFLARAPAPSLSLLAGPLCQLPRPRVTARPSCAHRGLRANVARRARNRPALGHLSPRAPLTLSLPHLRTCRTSSQPPPPHAACTPERSRRPEPVSPSTSEPRRARCHGELCLDIRNSRHAPISPLPP
jgi:hypothetical protein